MDPAVDVLAPPPQGAAYPGLRRKGMSRASKIWIAVAALLLLAGLILAFVEPDSSGEMRTSSTGGANLIDAQGNPVPVQGTQQPDWSPGFLKMGFSFFVCFALGYAARKFLKVALVVAGVVFGLLFLASYLGYVNVDTAKMGTDFDAFLASAKNQFDSFKTFVTGSLPAAGLGAAGLVTGFKQG